MRRHPALIELSHDHHAALFVALQLKRADESSAEKARSVFLAYWDAHGNEHFRQEEEVLFPGYAAFGPAHHPMIAHALCDHVAIRRLAHQVADEAPDVGVLVELGIELEHHVRFEERALFPLIEESMSDDALVTVGHALRHDERGPSDG